MITKNELCWIIVNEHFGDLPINEGEIYHSSSLGVAMLHLGLIKDESNKTYAESLDGFFLSGESSPKYHRPMSIGTLTLKDVLSLLPD